MGLILSDMMLLERNVKVVGQSLPFAQKCGDEVQNTCPTCGGTLYNPNCELPGGLNFNIFG